VEQMTKCVQCGGRALHDGVVTHELTVGGARFVVEGVPAEICNACGESYVTGGDIERAELTIAAELARRGIRSGESFRFMRKALGLRSNALAELFDLQPETVSRWEKGMQTLDPRAFALLGALVVDRLEGREETALARLRALRAPAKAPRAAIRITMQSGPDAQKPAKRKRARKVA
jgi:putative zinc finger/helix-turn-helix YgiT family protein